MLSPPIPPSQPFPLIAPKLCLSSPNHPLRLSSHLSYPRHRSRASPRLPPSDQLSTCKETKDVDWETLCLVDHNTHARQEVGLSHKAPPRSAVAQKSNKTAICFRPLRWRMWPPAMTFNADEGFMTSELAVDPTVKVSCSLTGKA